MIPTRLDETTETTGREMLDEMFLIADGESENLSWICHFAETDWAGGAIIALSPNVMSPKVIEILEQLQEAVEAVEDEDRWEGESYFPEEDDEEDGDDE